jgi:hypothetical protein
MDPLDNPLTTRPIQTGSGFQWNRTQLTVQVDWPPGPPIWQQLGSEPDPDTKWRSGTVANTKLGWFGAHYSPDGDIDLWHHLKWTELFQDWILHLVDPVWCLVEGNQHSGTPENYWTCSTYWISEHSSSEPYIRLDSVHGFWGQFYLWYF